MSDADDVAADRLRLTISSLRKPLTDLSMVTSLLAAPLAFFDILPERLKIYNTEPIVHSNIGSYTRYIRQLQDAVLQTVLPNWQTNLSDEGLSELIDLYFVPPDLSNQSGTLFAIHAHASLLAALAQLPEYASLTLARLSDLFTLKDAFRVAAAATGRPRGAYGETLWADHVQAIFAVPGRVANALGSNAPETLAYSQYHTRVLREIEALIYDCSASSLTESQIELIAQLFSKLATTGLLSVSTSWSHPSFFQVNSSAIQRHAKESSYSKAFIAIISSLSSTTAQKVLASLLDSFTWQSDLAENAATHKEILSRSLLFEALIGPLTPDERERWEVVSSVIIGRPWPEELARVLVRWTVGQETSSNESRIPELISRTLKIWTSPQHVKFSPLSRHRYLTTILLLSIARLPPRSPTLQSLSTSATFLESVGVYIGHSDGSIRRCGMLAAEILGQKLGKNLDFGDWGGDEDGRRWCRSLRGLVETQDDYQLHESDASDSDDDKNSLKSPNGTSSPKQSRPKAASGAAALYDSDDSLTGYASASDSSRSTSPTPSDLAQIEKDPSLVMGRKKIPRPVYLLQLGQLLVSGKANDQDEPDRVEIALNDGAALIRRKKGYGLELQENAVNLCFAFVQVHDKFDLDGFAEKRQNALDALVASCPEQAAPCLIEQFFIGKHPMDSRSAILTALVTGGRELAGFPSSAPVSTQSQFASKKLPPALHRKYLTAEDVSNTPHPELTIRIMEGISRQVIDKTRNATEAKIPQIVREKQLRVRQRAPIAEVQSNSSGGHLSPTFSALTAEYFIMPMVNRFWVYLRDEQNREDRSGQRGAGTGIIIGAPLLGQFLLTLAILMHASRHSTAFLAVLVPETVELAVTLATSRASTSSLDTNAEVLAAALELTLVALDASWELDQGRTLGLEHARLLMGVRQWTQAVFQALDGGARVDEGGGEGEERVRRASAGVLLAVEEIIGKWRGAMIQL